MSLFPGNLEKAFSMAKELGFDAIEISISKLKDLVNKYQIKVSATVTGGAAVRVD